MKKRWMILLFSLVFLCSSLYADGTPESRETFLKQLSHELDYILENYYGESDEAKLRKGILNGLHRSLDPWTESYSDEEYRDFVKALNGDHVGLGIYVEKEDDHLLITEVVADSSAEKAGLKAGDRIYEAAGKSFAKLSLEEAISLLKGEKGSSVTIKIKRKDALSFERMSITRKPFVLKSVRREIKDGIHLIKILQFGERSYEEFVEEIEKIDPAEGFILDLRDNPGGYLHVATEIADELLPVGDEICTIREKDGDELVRSKRTGREGRVIVLVNERSASASELLAAALKENGRALLIGEKTYGKGLMQSFGRRGERIIKLSSGEFKSPKHNRINGIGVLPDIRVGSEGELFRFYTESTPIVSYTEFIKGDRSEELVGLKERLNYLGDSLELSPIFDDPLAESVNKIKKMNKLSEDGKIDEAFKLVLKKEVEKKADRVARDQQEKKAIEMFQRLPNGKDRD